MFVLLRGDFKGNTFGYGLLYIQSSRGTQFSALEWRLSPLLSIIPAAVSPGCSVSFLGIFNWQSVNIITRLCECQSPLEWNVTPECCLVFLTGLWVQGNMDRTILCVLLPPSTKPSSGGVQFKLWFKWWWWMSFLHAQEADCACFYCR